MVVNKMCYNQPIGTYDWTDFQVYYSNIIFLTENRSLLSIITAQSTKQWISQDNNNFKLNIILNTDRFHKKIQLENNESNITNGDIKIITYNQFPELNHFK